MRVIGVNNRVYHLDLNEKKWSDANKSSHHLRAREFLKKIYGLQPIIEEVSIPGYDVPLYLDFFLPRLMIAIEVQGEQHYKFNTMFHQDKKAFLKQQIRDGVKKYWCETNNIKFVEFPYNEGLDQWEHRLV